jgi:hypothetical protein
MWNVLSSLLEPAWLHLEDSIVKAPINKFCLLFVFLQNSANFTFISTPLLDEIQDSLEYFDPLRVEYLVSNGFRGILEICKLTFVCFLSCLIFGFLFDPLMLLIQHSNFHYWILFYIALCAKIGRCLVSKVPLLWFLFCSFCTHGLQGSLTKQCNNLLGGISHDRNNLLDDYQRGADHSFSLCISCTDTTLLVFGLYLNTRYLPKTNRFVSLPERQILDSVIGLLQDLFNSYSSATEESRGCHQNIYGAESSWSSQLDQDVW